MPTYVYRCQSCEDVFEVQQAFTADPLATHDPALVADGCGGPVKKVFQPVGITFKGSGFYKTDSRGSSGKAAKDTKDSGNKDAGGKDGSTKDGSTKDTSSGGASTSSTPGAGGSTSSSGSDSSSSGASSGSGASSSSSPSTTPAGSN